MAGFLIPVIALFVFVGAFFIIIFSLINKAKPTTVHNNQPVVTVNAVVLAKRTAVQNRSELSHSTYHVSYQLDTQNTYSTYHVSFELGNRSRFELEVPGHEFGKLVERDMGKLTFQGTKYISFERHDHSYGQPTQNSQDNGTKRCPYCTSIVKNNAVKCDNCGAGF